MVAFDQICDILTVDLVIGIPVHGSKLVKRKPVPLHAHAGLSEDDRARRRRLYGDGRDENDGGEEYQADERPNDIDPPLKDG